MGASYHYELKPCPFCNQQPIAEHWGDSSIDVLCVKCQLTMGSFNTAREAHNAWNARPPLDREREAVVDALVLVNLQAEKISRLETEIKHAEFQGYLPGVDDDDN